MHRRSIHPTRTLIVAFLIGVTSSFVGGTLGLIAASPLTETRTERVFVYGTLTNPLTRTFACRCLTSLTPARLDGYVRTVRDIIPSEQSFVRGGIIMVSPAELTRLDRYEDAPERYVRERVIVGVQAAWVYRKVAP